MKSCGDRNISHYNYLFTMFGMCNHLSSMIERVKGTRVYVPENDPQPDLKDCKC